MRLIDRFAYNNRIRKLDPAWKAGFSLLLLLSCLTVNRAEFSAACLTAVALITVLLAGIPLGPFLKILFTEAGFLVLSVGTAAVSVSTIQSANARFFFGLWFSATQESLAAAGGLFLRSLACVSAMNLLALTTPMVDLIDLMTRMKVPDSLIDILTLIYRFIFTLLDCLDRMIVAKEARLGFRTFRNAFRSSADIAASLFIDAYRRSQRLQIALEGRCWNGSFRVLPRDYESPRSLWREVNAPGAANSTGT